MGERKYLYNNHNIIQNAGTIRMTLWLYSLSNPTPQFLGKCHLPTFLYPRFEKSWGYTGLHLSVRPSLPSVLPAVPVFFLLFCFVLLNFSSKISPQTRMLIFSMQVDDGLLYRGIEKQPTPHILPCICPIFFPSIL